MNSRLAWFAIFLLVVTGMVSACGQKGPLYLPDKTGQDKAQTR